MAHVRSAINFARSSTNCSDRLNLSSPAFAGEGGRAKRGGGASSFGYINSVKSPDTARARALRRNMTPPELRLWNILRTRPDGFKFRRQHSFGTYVLDFFCSAAALAIEVDGEVHSMGRNPERDAERDRWCAAHGVRTLRFAASDLLHEDAAIVAAILDVCRERSPSTASRSPSPAKAGEERSPREGN